MAYFVLTSLCPIRKLGPCVCLQSGFRASHCILRADALAALQREADLFILASHLHWALWSLPMSLSDMANKFDYIAYGRARMVEYLRLKSARLA